MTMPPVIPGRWALTLLLVIYAFIWTALEGDLRRDFLLSGLALLIALWHGYGRYLAGRILTPRRWIMLAAAVGFGLGAAAVLLTLFLMALKTGLHAHGPEYMPGEIAWVWSRLPLWSGFGLLSGLGGGLVLLGLRRS